MASLAAGTSRPRERPLHTLAYYTHYAMGANRVVSEGFRTVTGATTLAEWEERQRDLADDNERRDAVESLRW